MFHLIHAVNKIPIAVLLGGGYHVSRFFISLATIFLTFNINSNVTLKQQQHLCASWEKAAYHC